MLRTLLGTILLLVTARIGSAADKGTCALDRIDQRIELAGAPLSAEKAYQFACLQVIVR